MDHHRSVLLISRWFPPEVSVGGDRPAGLAKHLARSGWQVTVVSAGPAPDAAVDPGRLVPAEVEVLRPASPDLPRLVNGLMFWRVPQEQRKRARARAQAEQMGPGESSTLRRIIDWLSWWLQVPDGYTGWLLPAIRAGIGAARRHRPDVIFSTGPVWTAHLVGLILSRLLRRPWVADFRDPWSDSAFREVPYASHRSVTRLLERLVVLRAARVTCAWDGIRKHLMAHYPHKGCDMGTVLNGFDPEELDPIAPVRLDAGRCVLLHAGTFYGPRSPVLLLEALARLRSDCPDLASRLHVALLGEPTYEEEPLNELARRHGVPSMVHVMPRVPHRQAIAILKGADVAVLFGQGGDADSRPVAAKVYEYIGMGKPILAIGAGHEALDIMRRGGCRVWAPLDSHLQGIAAALREIVEAHASGNLIGGGNSIARLAFTRSRMAEELTSVINEAIMGARKCR